MMEDKIKFAGEIEWTVKGLYSTRDWWYATVPASIFPNPFIRPPNTCDTSVPSSIGKSEGKSYPKGQSFVGGWHNVMILSIFTRSNRQLQVYQESRAAVHKILLYAWLINPLWRSAYCYLVMTWKFGAALMPSSESVRNSKRENKLFQQTFARLSTQCIWNCLRRRTTRIRLNAYNCNLVMRW